MSEQAVKLQQIVPAAELDTAIGEQSQARVSFVDAAGLPVDVSGAAARVPAVGAVTEGRYVLVCEVDAEGVAVYSWQLDA